MLQFFTASVLAGRWDGMSLVKGMVLTCVCHSRTLIYLEGDATMRTYDDAEGKKQSSLSLVQTKIEVLKRPAPTEADNAGAVGH
jgi:hypothetical protein